MDRAEKARPSLEPVTWSMKESVRDLLIRFVVFRMAWDRGAVGAGSGVGSASALGTGHGWFRWFFWSKTSPGPWPLAPGSLGRRRSLEVEPAQPELY